jgi:hypothetical protein
MRRLCLTFVVGAALVLTGGCGQFGHLAEVHYRISVGIDTPEGLRAGAGVWSFELRRGNIDQGFTSRFQGEAIPIDLPNGKTIFALLDLRGPDNLPVIDIQGRLPELVTTRRLFPNGRFPPPAGISRPEIIKYIQKHVHNRVKLNCKSEPYPGECPLLVSFRNPADPNSVYALDPDNLTEELGPGYTLDGMYLQVTDDRPTHQLERRLPWEASVRGKHLDGSDVNRPMTLASRLTILSFKKWDR